MDVYELWLGALFALYAVAYLTAGSMWFIIDPRKTFYRETVTAA